MKDPYPEPPTSPGCARRAGRRKASQTGGKCSQEEENRSRTKKHLNRKRCRRSGGEKKNDLAQPVPCSPGHFLTHSSLKKMMMMKMWWFAVSHMVSRQSHKRPPEARWQRGCCHRCHNLDKSYFSRWMCFLLVCSSLLVISLRSQLQNYLCIKQKQYLTVSSQIFPAYNRPKAATRLAQSVASI